jgi:hypothetical protein
MTGILEISIYGNLLRSWLALIGVVTVVTRSRSPWPAAW